MNHKYMAVMHKKAYARQTLYVIRAYYAGIQFGVNGHTCTHVEDICDIFIQMSEY